MSFRSVHRHRAASASGPVTAANVSGVTDKHTHTYIGGETLM